MFRSSTTRFVQRISDLIDDALVGDFEYIADGEHVYADVDYYREHPHHCPELTWTPAAGRGAGPQRGILAGPQDRRPGTVAPRPPVCLSPVRPVSPVRPATVADCARPHR